MARIIRTLADMRGPVQWLLNFSSSDVTNFDFYKSAADPNGNIDFAISEAERVEYHELFPSINPDWLRRSMDLSWPVDTLSMTLPAEVNDANLEGIEILTDGGAGLVLDVGRSAQQSNVFWKNNQTLQWGSEGPSSEQDMRLLYFAQPVGLAEEEDEPDWLPVRHRHLLIWSAAIVARLAADNKAPGAWEKMLGNLRLQVRHQLSMGRPVRGGQMRVLDTDHDQGR